MDAGELRRINLIEVLQGEANKAGRSHANLPPDATRTWTELQIRNHFSSAAQSGASPAGGQAPATAFPEPSPEDFAKWFPGLPHSKTACENPRWRVLCFANAGSAEDMYTSEGTGTRRAPSPLLEWCRENAAECLAVQLPGHMMRGGEPFLTSPQEVAAQLLPVVASRIQDTPYVVIAHSVGTWNAFEFLHAARAAGLPMPRHAFLSAMAAPDIPEAQRPWRRQRDLSEPEFQDECATWDVNEVVFTRALWPTYHQLMRSDFRLFDEYVFEHEGKPAFEVPITAFYGSRDQKISPAMVAGWQRFTTAEFAVTEIEGNHLWPLKKAAKADWLSKIAAKLQEL